MAKCSTNRNYSKLGINIALILNWKPNENSYREDKIKNIFNLITNKVPKYRKKIP